MSDKAKIQADYENLKRVQYTDLLPLEKVLELEDAKVSITEQYLSKITKIVFEDDKYVLETESGFTLSELLGAANDVLGDINYIDKDCENGVITIDAAFTYGIIGLMYADGKMKYSMTVFWDI